MCKMFKVNYRKGESKESVMGNCGQLLYDKGYVALKNKSIEFIMKNVVKTSITF